MDRRRQITALALALAGLAAAPTPTPPLREMRWIAPGLPRGEVVRVLTSRPAECLAPQRDAANAADIAVGRAAFKSPLLLGGQAARAGLSCAACHVAGRSNPDFVFPGVSGAPGTADVTSSLFSSRRGDGIFNPKPIPDLAADPPKVSRDADNPALRQFIRGLIVEEFDGLEPPVRILDGLAAYVRALRGSCPDRVARSATAEADDVITAVGAASAALAAGDAASAHLLLGAARSALGRIDERFPGQPDIAHRMVLRDGELRRLQADVARRAGDVQGQLERWTTGFERDILALLAAEPGSLYTPEKLEQLLSAATGRPAEKRGTP
jgi:hypothetical protein